MNIRNNELESIQELIYKAPDIVEHKVLETIEYKNEKYPIHSFSIGNQNPNVPVFGLFGGVHGLEQVGTHVVIAYLNYLFEQLSWDKNLTQVFDHFRLVSIPIVNPVGFFHLKRSNGNGVDLMRNAPIESHEKVVPLIGGHRFGNNLPWFRGHEHQEMETEAQVLCDFVKEKVLSSPSAITIDFHSGFGFKDRLWYPYANSTKQFEELDKINTLKHMLDKTIPHHIYKIEPQSDHYTTHGDLWDYLYLFKKENYSQANFLPLTLEMGSWIWLKKNPVQMFSKLGLYNPIKDHRFDRAMRRHFLMIDFFLKAAANPSQWSTK